MPVNVLIWPPQTRVIKSVVLDGGRCTLADKWNRCYTFYFAHRDDPSSPNPKCFKFPKIQYQSKVWTHLLIFFSKLYYFLHGK